MTLWGDHDLSTAQVVDAALTEAATTGLDVMVDLTDVVFMDASTIGAIVDGDAHIAENGHHLRLQGAHELPRRLLDICGLNGMIGAERPTFDGRPAPTTALEAWVEVPKVDRSSTSERVSEPDDPEPSYR